MWEAVPSSVVPQCLRKWGFRRCEDICWIKTNKNNPGKTKTLDPKAVFQRTKVPPDRGLPAVV